MLLNILVQEAQEGEEKWITSQIVFEVLHLSSKILTFLFFQTNHINERQVIYHKALPLMELPKPLYETVITYALRGNLIQTC